MPRDMGIMKGSGSYLAKRGGDINVLFFYGIFY